MKVLVNPDIHGRPFWKSCISKVDEYDKIIFLGDYLDPYGFEPYTEEDAIVNFEEIIDFANQHKDKVILLLGNHDMPYFDNFYYHLNNYHCRHCKRLHNDIHAMFDDNKELFHIAYTVDNILFTHAGVTSGWLDMHKIEFNNIEQLKDEMNNMLNTEAGLSALFEIGYSRGGFYSSGSCVWADVSDVVKDGISVKQVFGHTLQAYYGKYNEATNDFSILYGKAIDRPNFKMLDNCQTYILDTNNFTIEQL